MDRERKRLIKSGALVYLCVLNCLLKSCDRAKVNTMNTAKVTIRLQLNLTLICRVIKEATLQQ